MTPDTAAIAAGRTVRLPPCDFGRGTIPGCAAAVLEALRVDGVPPRGLGRLRQIEWERALAFCDRAQLTLTLGGLHDALLPGGVRARIRRNTRDYAPRFARLKEDVFRIAGALEDRGIGFALLKGIAHSPAFTPDPLWRMQGDIDIWCEPHRVFEARDALLDLGYRSLGDSHGRHLPPMVRETAWRWTGNYFAADLPIGVELHYELWDEALDFIPARVEDDFWERRTTARLDGRQLPVLSAADALGFAALHLLMHILHGDLRLQRAWELARFLHVKAPDDAFWEGWSGSHAPGLRRLEAIIFELCARWFGADLAAAVYEETRQLPGDVRLWLDSYALSPVEGIFRARKDEIWLHMALLDSAKQKRAVLVRRVFPLSASAGALQNGRAPFFAARLLHHAAASLPAIGGAIRWHGRRLGIGGAFLRFQAVSALYGFGVVIFVVLQNLYLLALGFHEDFLGKAAGLATLGTLAGSVPAAMLARCAGLGNTLLVAIAGVALASIARAWNAGPEWQLAAAFFTGLLLSVWAVCYSPSIAALSGEKGRRLAFSISCAAGMSVCGLGGAVAGFLPGWIAGLTHIPAGAPADRAALLAAGGLIALALPVAAGLRFPRAEAEAKPGRFAGKALLPLLSVLALWSAAVGAFNPLFNSFFAVRMGLSPARIGAIYSCSQALQAVSLLGAPALFRRWGNGGGVASLQLATAMALLVLACAKGGGLAASAYIFYMCFQYMTEPAVFSTLMSRVSPEQRTGASAAYFIATSAAAAIAAWAGGWGIANFGYPAVLSVSALVAMVCAALSLRFFR